MSIPHDWRHLAVALLTGCAIAFAALSTPIGMRTPATAQQAVAPIPPATKPKRNDQSPDLPPQAKPPRPIAPQTPPPPPPKAPEVKKPAAPLKPGDPK
jgi:hypothetical protein